MPKAIAWFLAAMFGFDLLRWINAELTLRYLDPARAHSYFSYVNACMEGGTVLLVIWLRLNGTVLDPNQTLFVIICCCAAAAALIAAQFLPRTNLEVDASAADEPAQQPGAPGLGPMMPAFLTMTAVFAAIEVSEDYLVKIVVKDTLQSYEAIREITDNYFSASCALIVLFSLLTGKAVAAKRVSPVRLMNIYASLMGMMSILCLATRNFHLFIAFEVTRRVSEYCLYSPGNQMIVSSFSGSIRPRIRARHGLYYYVLVPAVFAGIFSLTETLPIGAETLIVLLLILGCALAALAVLWRFRETFTSTMYRLAASGRQGAAVIAAHALSYLRPPDYVERMQEILENSPPRLLRKTVVLGLAYTHDEESVEPIKQQFQSDKEEIQLAALDALRIAGKFNATPFLLNILMDKARPKTQRVRINAMAAIAGIYGKTAIPFILNGLDDPDPRIVANALEVLSQFHDRDLKRYFLQHVHSPVPRIKANALIGLARHRQTRTLYNKLVRQCLRQGDVPLIASVLYAIGRLRDKSLAAEVIRIYRREELRTNPAAINVLSWALIRLNRREGLGLIDHVLLRSPDRRLQAGFLHFFSLHEQGVRFDIIKHVASVASGDADAMARVAALLEESVYDFHEETEYLKLYTRCLPRSLGPPLATALP